jgi:hypothetical protein
MDKEMAALAKNEAWDLVELSTGRKNIGNKWVFKKKLNAEGKVEKYKAWLVAKGYSQVEGIDFGEIFSPVAKFTLLSLKFHPQMVTGIQQLQIVMRSPMDQNYHKSISKRSKNIQPVIKLRCAKTTQGARTHARSRNARKAHMRMMHDYGR